MWEGTQDFVNTDQADCSDVIIFFGMSKSIIFIAVAVVSIFNVMLQSSASYFVKNLERHPDVTAVAAKFLKRLLGDRLVILFANASFNPVALFLEESFMASMLWTFIKFDDYP